MDFCGLLWIFADRCGSVTHPLDVTVYTNTEIVGHHRHYRTILILINCIIYKRFIFFAAIGIKTRVNKTEDSSC